MSLSPAAAAQDMDWRHVLSAPFTPILAETSAGLRPVPDGVAAQVGDTIVEQLRHRLVRAAVRTLVRELHQARRTGALTAATPGGRFEEFAHQLAGGGKLAGVLGRHPGLQERIDRFAAQAVEAGREFLDRFQTDRPDLVATLLAGRDPGELIDVEFGGDPHQGGRTVLILTFADGRQVVYKPRPLDLHAHFNDLVTWLDGHTGLGLCTATVLPRDGYGWMAYVPHRPCPGLAAVRRFYQRQGALLALLYVLDGTDMHYENLIADADQPVLVDVETLFHPTKRTESLAGADPATEAFSRSVVRTALLPTVLVGDRGAYDISGVGGDAGATLPDDLVDWADTGLDTMRLVRRPRISVAARNRPMLGGYPAEPRDHQAALISGFVTGYDAIVGHRDELLRPDGLLHRCADDEIRFVARPTRLYATLLDEATHPDALRDTAVADELYDILRERPPDPDLLPYELADLRAGDIPFFTTRPGSCDVWTSDGTRLPGLLAASGLAAAAAKIAALDELDRHRQEWLIAATLATRTSVLDQHAETPRPFPVALAPADPHRLLSAASWIADEVVAAAVSSPDRVNWLGLELVDDRHWSVLPMGAGLPSGYTGVALFLAQMARLTGAERYLDPVHEALRPVPRLLAAFGDDPDLVRAVGSGFHGLGGIGYALSRLADLLDDEGIRAWRDDVSALAGRLYDDPGDEPSYSFADGDAGGLCAALTAGAVSLAGGYAERLADAAAAGRLPASAGFATGRHGIAWALLRFGSATGSDRYGDLARSLAAVPDGPPAGSGWCRGSAGTMLGPGRYEPPGYLREAAGRAPLLDLSLCHGELGALEPLIQLARGGVPGAAELLDRRTGMVLGILEQHGARCGSPNAVPTPGLLTGLAGIGYGLLRLGFTDQVPSVLRLETDPHSAEETR